LNTFIRRSTAVGCDAPSALAVISVPATRTVASPDQSPSIVSKRSIVALTPWNTRDVTRVRSIASSLAARARWNGSASEPVRQSYGGTVGVQLSIRRYVAIAGATCSRTDERDSGGKPLNQRAFASSHPSVTRK